MKDKLLESIKQEDNKKPFTDSDLAELLNQRREVVTLLRKKFNIPDSRERREPYLINDIKRCLTTDPNISNTDLTNKIVDKGYDVSRFLISKIRKNLNNLDSKDTNVQKLSNELDDEKVDSFSNSIVGVSGSLKKQIQQAKAAVLYPTNGLNTLIVGPTGTGKNCLAEEMYKFALKSSIIIEGAPFVSFNCADYANNPELLMSYLFGHVKGAFTNAVSDKNGLVDKSNKGILFLDEVHRLPPEGQEMLFCLMDRGKYRRLGETESERSASVRIIAATSEDIDSRILYTFRRRFPMIIKLPPLNQRPINERLTLIKRFFYEESNKINSNIEIHSDVVKALLYYNCRGNIGQLRTDIQVACARGYLACLNNKKNLIQIRLSDLPEYVKEGLFYINNRRSDILNNISKNNLSISPSKALELNNDDSGNNEYIFTDNIYKYIEERVKELNDAELSHNAINRIIGNELDGMLREFVKKFKYDKLITIQELENIVGRKIIDVVQKMLDIARKYLGDIDDTLFICLALHTASTLERLQQNKPIFNPHLNEIKSKCSGLFNIAVKMCSVVEKEFDINLPEDEVAFIAAYLNYIKIFEMKLDERVGVIVATHGNAAESIVYVANTLLGTNHAKSFVMSLDEKPEDAYKRFFELAKNLNSGKGFVLIADMGSLTFFGDMVTKETNIPSVTIDRVDTVMVINILRKAILPGTSLKDLAQLITCDDKFHSRLLQPSFNKPKLSKVILAICITGEGAAVQLKKLVETSLPEIKDDIEIKTIGAIDTEGIQEIITHINDTQHIVACLGTVDPECDEIPFISLNSIINGSGVTALRQLLGLQNPTKKALNIDFDAFLASLDEEIIIPQATFKNKNEAIEKLCDLLFEKGFVTNQFKLNVYKREILGSTIYKNGIAIPHAMPEDTIKQVIGIATLKEPILWAENYPIDKIFILALQANSMDILKGLSDISKNVLLLDKLRHAKTSREIAYLIKNRNLV